jgi:periplasmic divalent cation tolerance protein
MERVLVVYTTFPDEETGLRIGESLVRDGLAACVNVIPGMRSVYAWKGAVERGAEVMGIVKTREGLSDRVSAAIRDQHPYETPIVMLFFAESTDDATRSWIFGETGGATV